MFTQRTNNLNRSKEFLLHNSAVPYGNLIQNTACWNSINTRMRYIYTAVKMPVQLCENASHILHEVSCLFLRI